MRWIGLIAVGVAVLVAGAIGFAILSTDTRAEIAIPLSDVPEGVSRRSLGRTPVFLVRDGRSVAAIVGRSTHLREPLHWCVRERLFYDPRIGGDLFDIEGRKVNGSGPAPRDLDRLEVRVVGDWAYVQTGSVVMGLPVSRGGGRGVPTSEWERAAATGPVCEDAVPAR